MQLKICCSVIWNSSHLSKICKIFPSKFTRWKLTKLHRPEYECCASICVYQVLVVLIAVAATTFSRTFLSLMTDVFAFYVRILSRYISLSSTGTHSCRVGWQWQRGREFVSVLYSSTNKNNLLAAEYDMDFLSNQRKWIRTMDNGYFKIWRWNRLRCNQPHYCFIPKRQIRSKMR